VAVGVGVVADLGGWLWSIRRLHRCAPDEFAELPGVRSAGPERRLIGDGRDAIPADIIVRPARFSIGAVL
jgi:hypothetical protein